MQSDYVLVQFLSNFKHESTKHKGPLFYYCDEGSAILFQTFYITNINVSKQTGFLYVEKTISFRQQNNTFYIYSLSVTPNLLWYFHLTGFAFLFKNGNHTNRKKYNKPKLGHVDTEANRSGRLIFQHTLKTAGLFLWPECWVYAAGTKQKNYQMVFWVLQRRRSASKQRSWLFTSSGEKWTSIRLWSTGPAWSGSLSFWFSGTGGWSAPGGLGEIPSSCRKKRAETLPPEGLQEKKPCSTKAAFSLLLHSIESVLTYCIVQQLPSPREEGRDTDWLHKVFFSFNFSLYLTIKFCI